MLKNFFLILIFFGSLFGSVVSAQAFSISPLKFSTTIAPGENKDWEVMIKNDSDRGGVFVPVILGLRQDSLGRSVFDNNIDIAENWFKIPSSNITLAPGETKGIIFSVNVPLNTPPGAHYLGLGIKEKSGQSISAQLMTVLNLQVSGAAHEALLLENFFTTKKIFFDKNWLAQLQVRNIGNIGLDLVAQPELFYFGQEFEKKSFGLGNSVFAQSSRIAQLNLAPAKPIILPGFYRVDLKIFYGFTHQTVDRSLGFWYLPRWFLALVVMIIFSIIVFVSKKNKNVPV